MQYRDEPFYPKTFQTTPMPKSALLCLSTYFYLLSSYILEYLKLYLLAFLDIFSIYTSRLSNERVLAYGHPAHSFVLKLYPSTI